MQLIKFYVRCFRSHHDRFAAWKSAKTVCSKLHYGRRHRHHQHGDVGNLQRVGMRGAPVNTAVYPYDQQMKYMCARTAVCVCA